MRLLIGTKVGMTRIYEEKTARVIPVTVIKLEPAKITGLRTPEKDGYSALCIGYGVTKRLNKPETVHLEKKGLPKYRNIMEFRTEKTDGYQVGADLDLKTFSVDDYVDITGFSKGKGFQGALKRHHFGGMDHGHGHTEYRNSPGSIGASSDPSKVVKNMRMAGRMGYEKRTVKNLLVVKTDAENGLLYIRGSAPGVNGCYLKVKETKQTKKKRIPPVQLTKKSKKVK